TIARNGAEDGGGIANYGSLVVRNSAIIFNGTDEAQPGGGILNVGTAKIVNSNIANNVAGVFGVGGGLFNTKEIYGLHGFGQVSIINSTIRDNSITSNPISSRNGAAGIANDGGTVQIQNTIVAGNTPGRRPLPPDCSGTITSLGN